MTKNLDIFVATDEKWIIFILNQVVNNSIKYLEKNKTVLEIKDNGCDIKESDVSRVFEKGFIGSNRTKEHSIGFALYLCKNLCIKLNLNIEKESRKKEYTIVNIFSKFFTSYKKIVAKFVKIKYSKI